MKCFELYKRRNKILFSFLLVFITITMKIHAQGPSSPEAAGFEPVDATDMVNLTNGNLSYVLPLLDVEGFPVNLSYHAGIPLDMESSWVGLGWYLNPGAVNRTVTNTPDDWKSGVGINFNSYYNQEHYYGVSVELGFPGAASVGVGLNWGGGQGLSGSVNASYGPINAKVSSSGDASVGVGLQVLSIGPASIGVGISYSLKNQWDISGVANVSKSLGDSGAFVNGSFDSKGTMSVGGAGDNNANKARGNRGGVGMGSDSFSQGDANIDSQSTGIALPLHFIGLPITLGFGKTTVRVNVKKAYLNYEWGALYSNDYNGLANQPSQNGPRIEKVKNSNGTDYNEFYSDYMVRTKSMDVYSTRLPQLEEDFISDYSKTIENINFTFMGYDDYNVSAQGLMGSMTPNIFQNSSIYGKGQNLEDEEGNSIHAFWHHGSTSVNSRIQKKIGRSSGTYDSTDLYFYFNGQYSGNETNDLASVNSSYANSTSTSARYFDSLINEGNHNGASNTNTYHGRAKTPNYIEVFTNKQIASGHAASRGLVSPTYIPNSDRIDLTKFDPDGIGAYKITSADGKTYHFTLPVYHFEQVQRGLINKQEDTGFNVLNVNEKRQFSRYATHWLLTAITGADYIDRPDPNDSNKLNTFNKEDYGYWVELEYGKWSDGYVWRTPYKDRVYNYSTNLKDKIEEEDKGSYSFGRKQLYYLDKINTKNKTALFVKELREDSFGKNLKFKFNNNTPTNLLGMSVSSSVNSNPFLDNTGNGENPNSLKYTSNTIHVRETDVEYKREYSLKLSKIILVNTEDGKNLSKNTQSSSTNNLATSFNNFNGDYTPNDVCYPNWESPYFHQIYTANYSYGIHNEKNVLDIRDIPSGFLENKSLKVIEFNHNYDLAKNSPSSSEVSTPNNSNNGRLTLNSVKIKGKGGFDYMPPTSFSYYMSNVTNLNPTPLNDNSISDDQIKSEVVARRNRMDNWGFQQGTHTNGKSLAMAWSLKEISMPTGAKINIDYEEDDYWIEAFARRYWEDDLKFKTLGNLQERTLTLTIRKEDGLIDGVNSNLDFTDYFDFTRKVLLDFYVCNNRESAGCHYKSGVNLVAKKCDILSLQPNEMKVIVRDINVGSETWDGTSSGLFCTGHDNWNKMDKYSWIMNHSASGYVYEAGQNGIKSCPGDGGINSSDRLNIKYRILANKVPEHETGGGLRVKELKTITENDTYKVQYDYNHPTENRSSGITSYAPVNGVKYVPYQSELPAPGVMYEYVTMKETSNNGDFESKTRFRHHVLKPVFNIFNPNIEMEALDANAGGEDKIFWASVEDDYEGLNGNNLHKVKSKKINIHINSALIGQMKSIEKFNKYDHLLMKTENEYINGVKLVNSEPYKGYTKETFNSMKTIFQTNDDGTRVENVKRLLSISSKTNYNNMLKKTITYGNGNSTYVEYEDVDPWLGSFRKSKSLKSDGKIVTSHRVPAYTKYSGMQSKSINHSNKNMLTQEAMNVSQIGAKTLNASITTWNNNWVYRDEFGSEISLNDIWRKHKTYIWKEDVNLDGTYITDVNPYSNYFNWSTGVPTNDSWQNTSEITRYNHFSSPLEVKDINGNFASSKMADNWSKTVASGNARYTEMYYSGAEYPVLNGNFVTKTEDEFTFENCEIHNNYKHTGDYSIRMLNNAKAFRIIGDIGSDDDDITKQFRPGKYKVSFWVGKGHLDHLKLVLNGVKYPIDYSSMIRGSYFSLVNFVVDFQPNQSLDIYLFNENGYYIEVDDFRLHPISSSISSYVYDKNTDELRYILDANNLATEYQYDMAGRLQKVYKEVVSEKGNTGALKLVNEYKYNYKNN